MGKDVTYETSRPIGYYLSKDEVDRKWAKAIYLVITVNLFLVTLIFDHMLSDRISIFSSGKYVALEWSEICLYEFAFFYYLPSEGHFTLVASTGTIILVPYLLSQVIATHLKIGHP